MGDSGQDDSPEASRPWSPGMTLLFGAVIFFGYSLAQGLVLAVFLILEHGGGVGPAMAVAGGVRITGLSLTIAIGVSCPVMLLACGLLGGACRGIRIGDYLALRPVGVPTLIGWTFAMLVLGLTMSQVNEWVGHPPSEFMQATFKTAGIPGLFWTAVVILAPVAEETLFRGFLYPGLLRSWLGKSGTLAFTSVVFMLVHAGQYGGYDMAQVGIVGVALGVARIRTGSLLPPLAMHVTLNLVALLTYALQAGGG